MKIKIIAFDLDGTLLKENKELSRRNTEALCRAAEKGICLVPASGRLYAGMPEELRRLPFIRYVIGVNGAEVYDIREQRVLYRAEMTNQDAARIFAYVKEVPAIWGCYKNGTGIMEEADYEKIDSYAANAYILKTMKRLHRPIKGMKEYLVGAEDTIQKLQLYFFDIPARNELLRRMKEDFTDLSVSTSLPNNIEINALNANKGAALRFLCGHLGVAMEESMAFGDGTNDLSMIRAAGTGVAMKNACPEVLKAADRVTLSNEEDGVAYMIEQCVLSQN